MYKNDSKTGDGKYLRRCTLEVVARILFDIDLQEPRFHKSNEVRRGLIEEFNRYEVIK